MIPVHTHKTHRKKKTIVEEVEPEYEMEETVNVSYVSNSHGMSPDSALGMLIVNFLVHGNSPVTTNVVTYEPSGEFVSLYNFDLFASLRELGLDGQILVARSGFENSGDTTRAVTALAAYLNSVRRGMPHEDQELLASAQAYLKGMSTSRGPSRTTLRSDQSLVRGSVGSSVPVVRRLPPRSPVRTQPRTRKTTVYEESSSSSTEEEIVETITQRSRGPR